MESCLTYAIKNLLSPNYKFVLEFGVYKGDTLREIVSLLDYSYKIFGFDSFQGLPEQWLDAEGKQVGRGYKGRFSTNGIIPKIDNVSFYPGWFEQTIDEYKMFYNYKPITLLHIDCDLYSSTKTILDKLGHCLVSGSIIVFDEWFYNHDPRYNDHEQKAFIEWSDFHNINYQLIDYHNPHRHHEEEQIVVIQ